MHTDSRWNIIIIIIIIIITIIIIIIIIIIIVVVVIIIIIIVIVIVVFVFCCCQTVHDWPVRQVTGHGDQSVKTLTTQSTGQATEQLRDAVGAYSLRHLTR